MSRTALETSLGRWKVVLMLSSLFGSICGLMGTTLGVMSLLRLLTDHRLLDIAGTVLLVVAFPLLVLAAHSLDKVSEADKAIRIESCRRTGLMTDDAK